LQFRAEFLNAFNHVRFPNPNRDVTSDAFGTAIAANQVNYPRRIQLSMKFVF
jgi:hypothetical protein